MRGSSHMMMSLLVYFPTFLLLRKLVTPVTLINNLNLVLIGIALGSLLPDLDASDSKIMHGAWKPIGVFSKYVFYKSLRHFLAERMGHREALHSLFGCLLASSFFGLASLILYLAGFFFVPISYQAAVFFFWIGIPVGYLLHLTGDSFTFSGVRWFYPKDTLVRSSTLTSSGGEYFLLLLIGFIYSVWALCSYYLIPASLITLLLVSGVSIALLVLLHRINPRISNLGDRLYSLDKLVVVYYSDMGGREIKPREPSGSVITLHDVEDTSVKPYIAKITSAGGRYALKREWLTSPVSAEALEDADVIEVRFVENHKETRVCYKVQNGEFYAFVKKSF